MKNLRIKGFEVIAVIDIVLAVINEFIIRDYFKDYYYYTTIYSKSIRNFTLIPIVLIPILGFIPYIFFKDNKKLLEYVFTIVFIIWFIYLICILIISINNIDFIREIIVCESKYTVGYVISKIKDLIN
ncbi:MAG: hypothetical protein ACI4VF_04640 [Lachnospirales bacterium]